MLEKFFKLKELETDVKTELLGGLTTFLTMSYIIFVNPLFLSFFGEAGLKAKALPFSASMTATCLSAAVMCMLMGLWTNYPFALAPGMGLNAIVAYQLVLGMGLSWPSAMGVIVIEGIIITVLVVTGFREAVMNSIPMSLKQAISVGIGLFLAFIGLKEAGFIKASQSTFVTLGDFTKLPIVVSFLGLVITAVLIRRKVKGGLLIGIIASTLIAVTLNYFSGFGAYPDSEYARIPQHLLSLPDFSTIGRFDFGVFARVGVISSIVVIFSIMLSDFFDTLGTVIGIGGEGKFLTPEGKLPRIKQVLLVDSLAAAVGGATSASSVTTYIESAAGISAGARTGLSNIFIGILFILAMFFSPVAGIIPKEATAPVLIMVGFLMLPIIKEIPFGKFDEAFPAFLIMIVMPLTYSISNGIGAGFIVFTLLKLLTGKAKEVHWLMYIVSLAFAVDFVIPALKMIFRF